MMLNNGILVCPRRAEVPNWAYKDEEDYWRSDDTCSFCGSLSPFKFLEYMKTGCELGPTDKNYKVYVKVEGRKHEGKFYFMHLTEEQKKEFINLLNERPRRFTYGYPGHFYVLPYFVRKEVKDDH